MIVASEEGGKEIEDQEPIPTPQTTAKYIDISFSDPAA
jgi:hypothetical protein